MNVARAAQHKYATYKTIMLTGHSRGGACLALSSHPGALPPLCKFSHLLPCVREGNMADLFGRKLGLRSISINPATWGKILKEQEPAVESITARTADVISILESFSSSSRQVRFRWPQGATSFLGFCLALYLVRLVLLVHHRIANGAMPVTQATWAALWALQVLWVVATAVYFVWMHSVLRFTKT